MTTSSTVRRVLLLSLCMIGAAAAVSFSLYIAYSAGRKALNIPTLDETMTVTASIDDLKSEMGMDPVPEFTVAPEAASILLGAFKPVELANAPNGGWGKVKSFRQLGSITVRTKSMQAAVITLYDIGKTRLGFTLNGTSCVRGGDFKPVFVCDGYESYEDETELIVMIIREIYKEQVTHKKSDDLRRLLDALKRSRGEEPPEVRSEKVGQEKVSP